MQGLDEVMVATIMKEVLRALEYVHKQGGIHRDIKVLNLLVAHLSEGGQLLTVMEHSCRLATSLLT